MPKLNKPDRITADIAAALGTREREPKMVWYVSPEMAKQVPIDLLSALTSAPKWICEVVKTPRGALLVIFEESVLDQEGLTDVIETSAIEIKLSVSVLIQGKDPS